MMIFGKNVGEGQNFFLSSLLPELLGKWYTQPVVNSTNTDHRDENFASQSSENIAMANQSTIATTSSSQEKLYCYCCCPEDGLMIACDNTECNSIRIVLNLHPYQQGIGIALIVAIYHNF